MIVPLATTVYLRQLSIGSRRFPDHMIVPCGKVLHVTVISFQRGFIVPDPVNFLLAARMTQLGPVLADLRLSRPSLFCYAYSSVLPVCLLQVYISPSQSEGRISTLTRLVYLTLFTGSVPVAHPFAFQQPQKY